MAKQMGRDTGEPGRSKPKAKEQPKETNRGGNQAGKEAGQEEQVARYHIGVSGSQRTGIQQKLRMLLEDGTETAGTEAREREEEAKGKAIPAGRVSRAEGSGGCKVCTP